MKQTISKRKKYLGYTSYAVLLTVALLYFRFPGDAFKEHVQATLKEVFPRHLFSVGHLRPSFPPGLGLFETAVVSGATPDVNLFEADSLVIRPDPWSLLKGKTKYRFDCRAYGGEIRGSIQCAEENGEPPFTAFVELLNIDLGRHAYLSQLVGKRLKGALNGVITYGGQGEFPGKGEGEAHLRLSHGSVELKEPILRLESISFDDLLLNMVLKDGKIELTRGELEGREIEGSLSGSIVLKRVFSKSALDLKGTIAPLGDLFGGAKGASHILKFFKQDLGKKKFGFSIRGTFERPKFQL